MKSETVRVNVTFDERVLQRIDTYAAAHEFTRSGFLTRAASRAIEQGIAA